MSFLAPLFALGALAVAAPIIFHLIRRTSREKFRFSSLMFLQPTPPRMTRQSRLENLFLLLLRCLVLALLALGFARPFFQKQMGSELDSGAGRRVAILVDVSASMRQSGLWNDAIAKVDAVLRTTTPADAVALLAFDQSVRPLVSFEEWARLGAPDRVALTQKRLAETTPGWRSTHLGHALASAVEAVEDISGRDPQKPAVAARKIIVITDAQEGARLDGLQGLEWPRGLEVELQPVKPAKVTNAGLHLVADADERERIVETGLKVRVSNSSNSRREQFKVGWAQPASQGLAGSPVDVYVPPGQSRVATIPFPTNGPAPELLRLTGDDEDFDNTVYYAPPKAEQIEVIYLGADAPTDSSQPLYYLRRAFQETRRLNVSVNVQKGTGAIPPAETARASLLLAAGSLTPESVKAARSFLESGRTVVYALPDAGSSTAASLAELLGLGSVPLQEADTSNGAYALLGQIDFQHPIFAPFADPRFSDFTKIHFWKHRVLDPAPIKNARVIARFDRGDPALVEIPVGKGSLFLLTSGWQPADSQFALSSKFVPMLYSLLEISGAIRAQLSQYSVGDRLTLTASGTNAVAGIKVRPPDGKEVALIAGQRFAATDVPGIYRAEIGSETIRVAVNLDAAESRTAPLALETLERLGVPLKPQAAADLKKEADKKERLKAAELEQRQKLWRWLLVGALIFLLMESAVAGRLSRRPAPAPAT